LDMMVGEVTGKVAAQLRARLMRYKNNEKSQDRN